jgi:poly-gamma-glutamate capsule biosynthesis protein CapA/YwtB (metallophosphatase superfamily)
MKYLSFTLLLGAFLTGVFLFNSEKVQAKPPAHQQLVKSNASVLDSVISEDTLIEIVAVGDIMLGTNFPNQSHLPASAAGLLEPFLRTIQDADLAFGNLEGTLLDEGGQLKSCSDPSKCYAFRQPTAYGEVLKNAGFDLLSIANNHLGDFGDTGRKSTIETLKKNEIKFAGQLTHPWDTITIKGVLIGFTAFAPNSECLNINHTDVAKAQIQFLDSLCDVVIVSFHGGAEGSSKTHITRKHEFFYGEDRGDVYHFARMAIDNGADLILGHGPHVTRAIDSYKGRFITYSMGNFCTYSRFNLSGVNGMAPLFKLKITKSGEFVSGEIISVKQIGEGGPLPDSTQGAYKQIQSLTKKDLPELQVTFKESGLFYFQ